jgi:VanZ family protein
VKVITSRQISLLILLLFSCSIYSSDSLSVFKKRKRVLCTGVSAFTGSSYTLLYQLWYKNYPQGKFHAFNDNLEWLQMDKCGHAFTTYQLGCATMNAMRWAGYHNKKRLLAGCFSGMLYMSGIEVMDGFNKGWGFSWGDMAANVLGASACASQEILWKEQRIQFKFSFRKSQFAKYRPELLGSNFSEQIIKDYNGQTYWLSVNLSSMFSLSKKFPTWLNIAFGYGATGMTGGHQNITVTNEFGQSIFFERKRHYYLSLDADLSKIKTRYNWLNHLLRAVNCLKIPFPSIEFSGNTLSGNLF